MSIITGCPTCHKAIVEGEYHPCSGTYERHPIGVMPRYIWKEKRLADIKSAMHRYTDSFKRIPLEWIEEYNELVKEVT